MVLAKPDLQHDDGHAELLEAIRYPADTSKLYAAAGRHLDPVPHRLPDRLFGDRIARDAQR